MYFVRGSLLVIVSCHQNVFIRPSEVADNYLFVHFQSTLNRGY